jgi:hypothetical protein
MAIAVFNEGTQRYHDPDTGRMVKSPQDNESQAVGSNLGASSIVSALRTEFKGLNAHLAFRFDSVIQAMQGTDAERRDDLITGENTDTPPPETPTDTGGKSFMDTLRGLNPFKDGIGTKTTILLLTGALFAITQFGDKLIKPLASFLEWSDGDPTESIAEYSEKFKKWWVTRWAGVKMFWADIKLKFEEIKEEYLKLKEWWEPKWASVKSFFKLFKDMFTGIDNWIKSYDEDKSGVLETDEIEKLVDDVFKTIKDSIWSLTDGLVTTLVKSISLITVGVAALKYLWRTGVGTGALAGARLLPLAAVGAGGLVGVAAIAGIIAAGIWTLTDNATLAYQDAITDEFGNKQDFDTSEFVSRLLGGEDPEGGWWNAVNNAWDKAVIGAAIGAGVGGIVGAAAGFVIGGVAGAVAGQAGAKKIDKWISAIESETLLAIDTVGGFFSNLVAGFKGAIDPDTTFKEEFLKNKFSNEGLVDRQMKSMSANITELEASNAAIAAGDENPILGESYIFGDSLIPFVRDYFNSATLFGKRISADPEGETLESLKTELLEFETQMIQQKEKEEKQKVLREGVNDKYYDANDVPKMSILSSDNSTKQNFSTFVGNKMDADNKSPSARLLGPAFVPGGSPLLNF